MSRPVGGPLPANPDLRAYEGARRPDRWRTVDSGGLRLAVYEWGEPDHPPLLVAHGGFDFAGTLDTFAPRLAQGGYRVISWDHRGHGDSEHSALYSWAADVRDAAAVLSTISRHPIPVIGHSKGGALMLSLANSWPHLVSHVVNIDGLPTGRRMPDVADHERNKMVAVEVSGWLERRRRAHALERPPGTIEDLARRRGRMNPRLSQEWLQYLVPIGARHDPDGWRWKIDPTMRMGGFGPWRPQWSMLRLPGIGVPFLGVLGLELEVMGWGTTPADVIPNLPPGGRLEALEGVGHFVHIEQPRLVADLVLEHLTAGAPAGGWS